MSKVTTDSMAILTEGSRGNLSIWSMDYPQMCRKSTESSDTLTEGNRGTLPSMDYSQMSRVSMDTLTERILNICGVTLNIFYRLWMSDGVLGYGWGC